MKTCIRCKEEKPLGDFGNRKASKDGLFPQCRKCVSDVYYEYKEKNHERLKRQNLQYYRDNRDKLMQKMEDYGLSEGVGVYKAIFPSGTYIGSGKIKSRGLKHMNGNSRIAKTLGEKATEIKVMCLCDCIESARRNEASIIDHIGLNNLLNSKRGG